MRPSRERGYVAVATAILATFFMGLLAFSVDTAMWFAQATRQQNAADAAALAGVVHLPEDPAMAAATAQAVAARNDFSDGQSSVQVAAAQDPDRPTRLRVTVSQTIQNTFGAFLGVPTTEISRTAVADFTRPPPIGNRCSNPAISDPDGFACYINVAPDEAGGQAAGGGPSYRGHVMMIHVEQSGYLDLDVYDPGWVVDIACEDPAACPIDFPGAPPSDPSIAASVATSFTLRYPSANPFDPLSGAAVPQCSRDVPGYSGADPASTPPSHFLQWVNVCLGPGLEDDDPFVTPGDYSLQIEMSGPPTAQNRLSVRANLNGAPEGVSIDAFQRGSMHLTAQTAETTTLDVVRLSSDVAGRLLVVQFAGVDDGMTIQLRWPDGSEIAGCSFLGPTGPQSCSVTIPQDYECVAVQGGCWASMDVVKGIGADYPLKWLAAADGSRVRLVQD